MNNFIVSMCCLILFGSLLYGLPQEPQPVAEPVFSMTMDEWAKLEFAQSCRNYGYSVMYCAELEEVYSDAELALNLDLVKIID